MFHLNVESEIFTEVTIWQCAVYKMYKKITDFHHLYLVSFHKNYTKQYPKVQNRPMVQLTQAEGQKWKSGKKITLTPKHASLCSDTAITFTEWPLKCQLLDFFKVDNRTIFYEE